MDFRRSAAGFLKQMRSRIPSWILGQPLRRLDRQGQYSRKPLRCRPITVAGFTMAKTSDHSGHTLRSIIPKSRFRRLSTRVDVSASALRPAGAVRASPKRRPGDCERNPPSPRKSCQPYRSQISCKTVQRFREPHLIHGANY
jgi:hypothetical protein